jgi:hypothetical protein
VVGSQSKAENRYIGGTKVFPFFVVVYLNTESELKVGKFSLNFGIINTKEFDVKL